MTSPAAARPLRWLSFLAVSVGAVIAAAAIRHALDDWVGPQAPLLIFLLATLGSATLRGTASGIVTTALGAVAGWYMFVEPRFSLDTPDADGIGALGMLLVLGCAVSVLSGSLTRARRRVGVEKRRAEDALAEARASLDRERAARAEAERLGRVRDDFLATVSHELRTPLNAIVGFGHLLADRLEERGDPEEVRMIGVIERNARTQSRLIDDMLDVTQMLRGELPLERVELDLRDPVRFAVESARPSADAKGVALEVDLGPLPVPVSGDEVRLQQIARNLVANAIKFTPSGGRVHVGLSRIDGAAELVVRDTGIGFAPEFLPHAFDRFAQQDQSARRATGGMGLGLAIVKQLAEQHGGRVVAASDGRDRGAELRVTLPLCERAPAQEHEPARSEPAPGAADAPLLAGLRVLLVEDDPDSLDLAARTLRERGAIVDGVSGTDDAIRRLAARSYDVLVSDIALPGRDGLALIREVRARAHGAGLRAIAVSARTRDEDARSARRAGFDAYVSKPIEPGALADAVARLAASPAAG